MWDYGADKYPSTDGFSFDFIRIFWYLMEDDVVGAITKFFNSSHFLDGYNPSFIALIPKVLDAKVVKDYQPISLIGFQYKIIGKILANRLALLIDSLVSKEQTAFIKDIHILNGPFIMNEVLAWCKAKKKATMVFKVDFEKAYDSVRWISSMMP